MGLGTPWSPRLHYLYTYTKQLSERSACSTATGKLKSTLLTKQLNLIVASPVEGMHHFTCRSAAMLVLGRQVLCRLGGCLNATLLS